MEKKIVFLFAVIFAVCFSFGLNAAAEEGITDTEIHIGQWFQFSLAIYLRY